VGTEVLKFRGEVPKNLIFLSIDTLRKDHLGRYGSGEDGMPFVSSLADEGVTLDNHQQCSNWTYGSTTCTLAGRYNIDRGHIPRLNGGDHNRPVVPEGTPFLASWLGDAGFYSILVSGNDWLSQNWGNTQGYTEELKPGGLALNVYETGASALQMAIATGAAERWFLHLHFMEPHAPYNPPEQYLGGLEALEPFPADLSNRDIHYEYRDDWPWMDDETRDLLESHLRVMYGGDVAALDERFELFWEELQSEGLLDDTLVVVWNDHGEQFWEHERQTHAYSLNSEENDGIALFWAKNIVPGRWSGPTASIDLVPTLLELYDLEIPEEVTGLPVGKGREDRAIFSESLARLGGVQAVTKEGWKLQFEWNGRMSLFDRNTDPQETSDLYDPTAERVLELWALLRPMVERMAPLVVDGEPFPNYPPELP
jgi:arylsulfatase A-like enzyme